MSEFNSSYHHFDNQLWNRAAFFIAVIGGFVLGTEKFGESVEVRGLLTVFAAIIAAVMAYASHRTRMYQGLVRGEEVPVIGGPSSATLLILSFWTFSGGLSGLAYSRLISSSSMAGSHEEIDLQTIAISAAAGFAFGIFASIIETRVSRRVKKGRLQT